MGFWGTRFADKSIDILGIIPTKLWGSKTNGFIETYFMLGYKTANVIFVLKIQPPQILIY